MVSPPSRTFELEAERELIESTIIDEMKRHARAAKLPKKFIEGIKLENVAASRGRTKWRIYNDWEGPLGEPLASWFERGTKRNYPIIPRMDQPKKTKRERERTPKYEKPSTGASYLHWERPEGKHNFRKRVIHPGQPAHKAMEQGMAVGRVRLQNEKKLQRLFGSNYSRYKMKRTLGSTLVR